MVAPKQVQRIVAIVGLEMAYRFVIDHIADLRKATAWHSFRDDGNLDPLKFAVARSNKG